MSPNTIRTGGSAFAAFGGFEVSQPIVKIFLEAKPAFMGMSLSSPAAGVSKHPCVGEGNPPAQETRAPGL